MSQPDNRPITISCGNQQIDAILADMTRNERRWTVNRIVSSVRREYERPSTDPAGNLRYVPDTGSNIWYGGRFRYPDTDIPDDDADVPDSGLDVWYPGLRQGIDDAEIPDADLDIWYGFSLHQQDTNVPVDDTHEPDSRLSVIYRYETLDPVNVPDSGSDNNYHTDRNVTRSPEGVPYSGSNSIRRDATLNDDADVPDTHSDANYDAHRYDEYEDPPDPGSHVNSRAS